jgi:ribonuclease P protein subunit POP4
MKITPDIIRHEFIGTQAKIASSPNSCCVGLSGEVTDETKNTFTLSRNGNAKRIIKDSAVFDFKFSDGTVVEIDGKLLVGRSEDRLKKKVKRLW